jgi:MFS family permease
VNTTSALIVDRIGRRRSFLIGLIGCASALIGECAAASFLPSTKKAVLVTGVFFIFWFIAWYGLLVDGVMYTYVSEIWPSEVRSEGIALSMSGMLMLLLSLLNALLSIDKGFWLATICYLQASPTGFANTGYKFYLLFILLTTAMWIFVYFFMPETSNIPMEEMGLLFGDEIVGTLQQELKNHGHGQHEHHESTMDYPAVRYAHLTT